MLISTNREAETAAFEDLLSELVSLLRTEAIRCPKVIGALHGTKLERYAYDLLKELAVDTVFDGSVELVSGQLFPDIIALQYYGVEVKTSKGGTWKSIGSSVAEGTRVANIERIYLLFGKLSSPIDFRCRLYQECLSGVAVTHSPRYTIDMSLKDGETFFDKLRIPYDELRRQETPIETIITYFRENLNPGETTWWLTSNDSKVTNAVVRLWSNLNKDESERLRLMGFCLFPELLGASTHKFNRMLLWLSTVEGVVVGNLRDKYTAGGRVVFNHDGTSYHIPQIVYRLIASLDDIVRVLFELEIDMLSEYWGVDFSSNRLEMWCKLITEKAKTITSFPLLDYLTEKLFDTSRPL